MNSKIHLTIIRTNKDNKIVHFLIVIQVQIEPKRMFLEQTEEAYQYRFAEVQLQLEYGYKHESSILA